ncbi:small GTP-binding protein domain-containing protein [Alteribacillus persepolensis]|uniref:Small GTP-binding protein domain-containing protein n=1 Tax=Alteribacillus persepolensis TaxID=568899 RepID=A0A1G7Z039_9BACI|nr:dynamin family protein [Alteribacillus persepolensis]SDH01876.1 small GTP-binding protein domain-containing protein [Alteribacillus persepolensis]
MNNTDISPYLLSPSDRCHLFNESSFADEHINKLHHFIEKIALDYRHDDALKHIYALKEKSQTKRYTAAFCGHFSAGKSTLINLLIGDQVLPAHPIPTSANIVHFQRGKEATFSYQNESTGKKTYIPMSQWNKGWFTDASDMKEVYLTLPVEHLPNYFEILDTPGIDSTDANHKHLAESRLFEADTVFYVVDYQKVQSEENFAFLKQLNDSYIKPVLIVNQMDKHDEDEMPFNDFKEHITKSLKQYRIHLQNIFFLSAKQPALYKSDWNAFLKNLYPDSRQSVHDTVNQTCALRLYQQLEKTALMVYENIQPGPTTLEYMHRYRFLPLLKQTLQEKQASLENIFEWEHVIEKDIFASSDTIFKNAKLTPYHTRNLVRDYLESRQASFRLKGLFAKKKTTREKERRKQHLLDSLNQNVSNYIDVHLRQRLQDILASYGVHPKSFQKTLLSIHYHIDESLLRRAERRGALFTQEYVLTYSRFIIDEIRKQYKQLFINILPDIKHAVKNEQHREAAKRTEEIETIKQAITDWEHFNEEKHQFVHRINDVIATLKQYAKPLALPASFDTHTHSITKIWQNFINEEQEVDLSTFYHNKQNMQNNGLHVLKQTSIHQLQTAASMLPDSLSDIQSSLADKAVRLQQKNYRITLFGGFSAGKSSLANALLGEHFLPVAANPTTAAIHYIQAPDDTHSHREVNVTYKSKTDILEDMNDVLQQAEIILDDIEDWHTLVTEETEKKTAGTNETEKEQGNTKDNHPLYVLTDDERQTAEQYYQSYHQYADRINTTEHLRVKEYQRMTSREDLAVLIKEVNVYFDCPFTKEGYCLVDTPGIGSIYRRHSQIAFEEMKRADAIFFVCYYNHAFSKADREFLLQLGRTKDYFTYDKFFFLVNASDLAKDDHELRSVLDYVSDQLRRLHITSPRVLPVSGKKGLQAHENNHQQLWQLSGIEGFLKHFQQFAVDSLEQTIVKEGTTEIKQAISYLQQQVAHTKAEESERQAQYDRWKQELLELVDRLFHYDPHTEWQWIEQELEELLFYVKQRVFYRYYDEFKDLFHAARFDDNADFPLQLQRAVNHLIYFIFHEIAQEIRATIIRMEYFIKKQWGELQEDILAEVSTEIRGIFVKQQLPDFPEITIHEEIPVQSSTFPFIKEYSSYYAFFVEQKSKEMKERFEEHLRPYGEKVVDKHHQFLQDTYYVFFKEAWDHYRQHLTDSLMKTVTEWEHAADTATTAQLQQTIHKLQQLV